MSDSWKDLFCNKWFKKLEDHGKRWSITHLSFDGVSIAEICDSDLNRLIDTWERILSDLEISEQ